MKIIKQLVDQLFKKPFTSEELTQQEIIRRVGMEFWGELVDYAKDLVRMVDYEAEEAGFDQNSKDYFVHALTEGQRTWPNMDKVNRTSLQMLLSIAAHEGLMPRYGKISLPSSAVDWQVNEAIKNLGKWANLRFLQSAGDLGDIAEKYTRRIMELEPFLESKDEAVGYLMHAVKRQARKHPGFFEGGGPGDFLREYALHVGL